MFWSSKHKEHERYYLLPGMGGSSGRRKRWRILKWSFAVGLVVSAIVAGILYWVNQQR